MRHRLAKNTNIAFQTMRRIGEQGQEAGPREFS
jgi:hypothetical protein